MDGILPQVRNAGFEAVSVLTLDEAAEHLWFGQFDVIVVGGGVEADLREKIRHTAQQKNTKMLEIFGPDTLLPKLMELKK